MEVKCYNQPEDAVRKVWAAVANRRRMEAALQV